MKIEKIIIRNLTSIEGEQVIDLTAEPLRSAGLFAITGDTGAGKSTILDAICLALYNKAPRIENIEKMTSEDMELVTDKAQKVQASSAATLLRRGQKQGGAEVTFSTPDGERYHAAWSIRMTRTGTYATPERTLTLLAPRNERIDKAQITARIEAAVGLSYEQFTRTVILAQNSFANFLRAKSSEKADLLEKLTGTELYGNISRQIYALTQEAKTQVVALEREQAGLLTFHLDAPQLEELRERQRLLRMSQTAMLDRQRQLQQQLDWIAQYHETKAGLAQREDEYASATKACMQMRGEELRLQRYDDLLPMQPLFQKIKLRMADIDRLKREEAEATEALQAKKRALKDTLARLDVAHERTADAEKQIELQRPVISRGHALTGEMKMAERQLEQQEQQLAEAGRIAEKRQAELSAKQEQQTLIGAQIKEHRLHRQTLESHRVMFDKFDLVKDKLAQLYTETERSNENHKQQTELQQRLETLKAQSEKAEKQQHEREGHLNTLKSELLIHNQANSGRNPVQLQQAAADSRNRLADLQRATTIWQHISENIVSIADKRAALKRAATELGQRQKETDKAQTELNALRTAFERVSTTYAISQSENITHLRKQLTEGTACPVCGATHHPYHTETERELGKLLTSLNREYNDLRQQVELHTARLNEMREQAAAENARIAAEEKALADLQARQEKDWEEWQKFVYLDSSFADCSETVNREARRMMLRLLIDNTTRTADENGKALDEYNRHQEQINRLNEQIGTLGAAIETSRTQLDNLRTETRITTASLQSLQQKTALSDRACAELYADLDNLITVGGWFNEWRTNADGLRLRITGLHQDWLQTASALDEAERAEALLQEETKGAEANVQESRRHVQQARELRDATRESIHAKREELRRTFGTHTPETLSEALNNALALARGEEEKVKKLYEEGLTEQHLLEGQRDNLLQSRRADQSDLQARQQELDLLILQFNGTHSPVSFPELDTLFSDPTDWNTLRQSLDALRERRTLCQNHLEQARAALLQLQASASRVDDEQIEHSGELTATLAQLSAEHEQMQRELHAAESRLLSHEKSEKEAARLERQLTEAREDANEWERLNTLFGSADGKKLRTKAQSYTFAFLVDHANHHLQRLIPRYELQNIPGTLRLEIIDHDMFDQHRYVSSLSGGETFVVSLALALALASVSSANLAIGTLFIDEGFGNLDRESLDLVMLALSNLENTEGRKVGVISHTEQIREQIQPQICLRKLPGGNSSVIEIR